MPKLAVIADDFTGALDTGVQFAKAGVATTVTAALPPHGYKAPDNAEVVVFDLETRHLPAADAGRLVAGCVETLKSAGVSFFYKKTDSALRGNIGAELEALISAGIDRPVFFIPAFPKTGRTTIGGRHYCDGAPVSGTAFGKDPFNPVTNDYIPDIIAEQSPAKATVVSQKMLAALKKTRLPEGDILIFDAASEEDMLSVSAKLADMGAPRLMAGCAGMAEYLPAMLGLNKRQEPDVTFSRPELVVISGSINEKTFAQIEYARKNGFTVINLSPEEKLCEGLADSAAAAALRERVKRVCRGGGKPILAAAAAPGHVGETDRMAGLMGLTAEETRLRVASNMGSLLGVLAEDDADMNFAVFGGDTLISAMRTIGSDGITPLLEISAGVVCSVFSRAGNEMKLITKSGGFGNNHVMTDIEKFIRSNLSREGEYKDYA